MAKISIKTTAKILGVAQNQFVVNGVKHPEGGHISRKRPVLLTFSGGKTLQLGDTNCCWLDHQRSDEQKAFWALLNGRLSETVGKAADVEVEVAALTSLGLSKSEQAASGPVSVDDLL